MTGERCSCGCCAGRDPGRPARPVNRPGLTALRYRIARHRTLLDAMLARLSAGDLPALRRLTTREPSDLSIALLDAWATVGDVITFYQERIANEGYLATATQQRSVLALGRLVGYQPRPGVAASVYLAYSLEADQSTTIPKGSRAQSVPGPGELPQVFETTEPLEARAACNAIRPRLSRPQVVMPTSATIYVAGTAANLAPGDVLVIEEIGDEVRTPTAVAVAAVEPDVENDRTKLTLGDAITPPGRLDTTTIGLGGALAELARRAAIPPSNAQRLNRDQAGSLKPGAAGGTGLLAALRDVPADSLTTALAGTPSTEPHQVRIYAMRVKARLFGHNAAPVVSTRQPGPVINAAAAGDTFEPVFGEWDMSDEDPSELYLDNTYEPVRAGGYIVVHRLEGEREVRTAESVTHLARNSYGMGGKTTRIVLDAPWFDEDEDGDGEDGEERFAELIRGTVVYAAPEELTLAEEPIDDDICGDGTPVEIELDGLYEGLAPGRWVFVSGERTEPRGVYATEQAMLSGVRHDVGQLPDEAGPIPGDTLHTFVALAGTGLAFCYRRSTVVLRANVVHATHGETRRQVLGSGDARVRGQRFAIKDPPVTYVSAPTATGVASTLEVRVNDVRWATATSPATLGPDEHRHLVHRADDGATSVVFGTGARGALLPTGVENVRASYRHGIGKAANVGADRISVLMDRPLGVKEVVNPRPATGGADPETAATARSAIPLPLKALDRLVSVADHADFARTFAGIGKAAAARLTDGSTQRVHVTVAGMGDAPLDPDSDVLTNLRLALHSLGDPFLPVTVAHRELLVLVIRAKVTLHPDYAWESVEPVVRSNLLDTFGFTRRQLAQDVTSSEVLAAIHRVAGVHGVDLDVLDWINEDVTPEQLEERLEQSPFALHHRVPVKTARVEDDPNGRRIRPAQLAILLGSVPDLLTLEAPWA